ncbi:hypothetical protein SCA6_015945 [Theobroma cacao]
MVDLLLSKLPATKLAISTNQVQISGNPLAKDDEEDSERSDFEKNKKRATATYQFKRKCLYNWSLHIFFL